MKVNIIYDIEKVKNEIPFIRENVVYFEKNNMFFRFPDIFEKEINKDNIYKQICIDEEFFQIKKNESILKKEWQKKEDLIFRHLVFYNKIKKIFSFEKGYKCFLSFYGCYGYYRLPNEIYVNIDADKNFIMETIVHELIHLLIYKEMNNKSFEEIEENVDNIFIESGLGKLFPKYKLQKFKE